MQGEILEIFHLRGQVISGTRFTKDFLPYEINTDMLVGYIY